MSNKQTPVGWFSNQAYELFEQYSEGNFDRITLNKLVLEATNKAKEMEKEQIEEAYKYARAHWSREDGNAERYYEQTYGGNR
jgi:hypothetical protein